MKQRKSSDVRLSPSLSIWRRQLPSSIWPLLHLRIINSTKLNDTLMCLSNALRIVNSILGLQTVNLKHEALHFLHAFEKTTFGC